MSAKVSTTSPVRDALSAGSFTFDGQVVAIAPGDTYASALHRAGYKVLSRSFKYHRPRGVYCNSGGCAGCFVAVDGVPSVPACMTQAEAGAQLSSQNTIGGAKRDVLAIVDKVYRTGFDPHGAFTRPRILNAAFMQSVRFMAGSGKAPKQILPQAQVGSRRQVTVDELVIGGGANGALRAAKAGAAGKDVLLVEERAHLGGTARWRAEPDTQATLQSIQEIPNVTAWTDALAFGHYGHVVAIQHGMDLVEVTAKRVTVAAGRHDPWPLFTNNDLPGIMSLHGAWRMLNEHKVLPGKTVAIHGDVPEEFKEDLQRAGGSIVAMGAVSAAHGRTTVRAATLDGKRVACDLIVCTGNGQPRIELLQQAGAELRFDEVAGGLAPTLTKTGKTTVPRLYAAFTEVSA